MILLRASRVEKLPVPKEGMLSHSPHMDRIAESRGQVGRWEEEQIQVSLSNSSVIPRFLLFLRFFWSYWYLARQHFVTLERAKNISAEIKQKKNNP